MNMYRSCAVEVYPHRGNHPVHRASTSAPQTEVLRGSTEGKTSKVKLSKLKQAAVLILHLDVSIHILSVTRRTPLSSWTAWSKPRRIEMQHIKPELSRESISKMESLIPTKQDRENTDNTTETTWESTQR
ncbi:uncharacterized protein [Asterias amurensis]|uniref:uncharacterized protein n=1 Tax=Asterias amurensis TaxID=7602 RepID=UPI003AB377D8